MSDTDQDLGSRLHTWATQEMHFHPHGAFQGATLPTPTQLRKICRGTHQTEVWNYVINNVASVQTVKKIRGNLQLKARSQRPGYTVKYQSDDRYDDQRQRLLAQRAQLLEEVSSVTSQTRQLEEELTRMQQDILSTESEYQRETESQRDIGRKTCLLQVYTHTCHSFTSSLDTLSDRLAANTHHLVHPTTGYFHPTTGVDTALHNRESQDGGDSNTGQLETSTTKDVRMSCELISQFLQQTLQGTFGKDRNAFHTNKDELWKQVEATLREHSIEQVVSSLVAESQRETQLLREHTMQVNIQRDAEKLKFKYEKGGVLTDTATQPSVLHSVRQLLEVCQLQHVMRFVETEKHKNTARPLLQQLEKTREKINAALKQRFPALPGNLSMASVLVQCQLDLVADRTGRDSYRQEAESLRERVAKEHANHDLLLSLHRKIQDFQDLANAKQSLIQVVAKQNAGAKSRLTAQHVDVSDYINRSIPSQPTETGTLTCGLRGAVVEEVKKAASLSLPFLLHLALDSETRRGLLDLSINFTCQPTAVSVRQPLHSALHHLHFPLYKAPECVLSHCMRLKEEEEREREAARSLDKHSVTVQLASGVHTDLDNVAELCDKVRERDKEELSHLLPTLHKRLNDAARASTDCVKLKDLVQAWWDQPAQHITPWVKAEGATYQQWLNKWNVIVTKTRQLDLHQ